jgi:hypothetical protein
MEAASDSPCAATGAMTIYKTFERIAPAAE